MKKKEKQIRIGYWNVNLRYFLWTIFGILFLGAIGVFATTNYITDQGITTPNGNFNNINSSKFNGVSYVLNNGTDIPTQINNLIASGVTNIQVAPASFSSSTTINLSTNNVFLDMSETTFNYTGTTEAVKIYASGLYFKFGTLKNQGKTAQYGIHQYGGGNNRIQGELIGAHNEGNNFGHSAIYIEPLLSGGGNSDWNIKNMEGEHQTAFGVYLSDGNPAYLYQGDSFKIGMMQKFENSSIKIGTTGVGDLNHQWFDVGFDGGSAGTANFIETNYSFGTFLIKSITTTNQRDYDVKMLDGSSRNLVITSRYELNYSDSGSHNNILPLKQGDVNYLGIQGGTTPQIKYFDNSILQFGNSNDMQCGWMTTQVTGGETYVCTTGDTTHTVLYVDNTYRTKDFDFPAMPDPTLVLFANLNPDSDNTGYIYMTHNNQSGVIKTGKGNINLDSASNIINTESLNVTGNITQRTNDKHCFDGATCSHYIVYNGTDTIIT